jgi:hypothetical protein
MGAAAPAENGDDFEWATPPGWSELPPSQFRLINLRPAKNAEADCYLSVASGGVLPNVNRWRKQFGQADVTAAEFAALPTQKLLDLDAVRVEVEGTFSLAMPGAPPINKSGFKLLGLVADAGGQQIFVKMTGPKAVVEQERSAFDAFVASVRQKEGGAPDAAAPSAAAPPSSGDGGSNPHAGAAGGGFDPAKLQFDLPVGWVKGGDKPMRVATFTPPNTKGSECYISIFPGDVGGLTSNVNRWRSQMGLPEIGAAEIAKLPKLTVMKQQATVVDLRGKLNDAMTNRVMENARFLGVICPLDGWTLFVKMTGPEAEISAAKDDFTAFCQSLRE